MSEVKRISLISFTPKRMDEKVTKIVCKTVRITVILPQSNEDTCPEYNYKEQLAVAKVSYNRKWFRFII